LKPRVDKKRTVEEKDGNDGRGGLENAGRRTGDQKKRGNNSKMQTRAHCLTHSTQKIQRPVRGGGDRFPLGGRRTQDRLRRHEKPKKGDGTKVLGVFSPQCEDTKKTETRSGGICLAVAAGRVSSGRSWKSKRRQGGPGGQGKVGGVDGRGQKTNDRVRLKSHPDLRDSSGEEVGKSVQWEPNVKGNSADARSRSIKKARIKRVSK